VQEKLPTAVQNQQPEPTLRNERVQNQSLAAMFPTPVFCLYPSARSTAWTSLEVLNKCITEQHAEQQQAGYDHGQIPEAQGEGNIQEGRGVAAKVYRENRQSV